LKKISVTLVVWVPFPTAMSNQVGFYT